MKKILPLLLFVLPYLAYSQTYQKEFEVNFAWNVKQINEFIERFNNDSTLITQFHQKTNAAAGPLTRERLIKSLFNTQRTDWSYAEISGFIKQVDNSSKPEKLEFTSEKWYGTLTCSIPHSGKPEIVILKLQIEKAASGGYRWSIADAESKFLNEISGTSGQKNMPLLPKALDSSAFLNPASHTNNFIALEDIFETPQNISNYIIKADRYSDQLIAFVQEWKQKRLGKASINNIIYTFLQIKGWRIEVEQFERDSKNSGWLINKLVKTQSS